ncbi:MAG: ABC transporter permease [Proteobacteria bacterium]|nr:ABC transporter permease [Pseudomonadota bacterium]
MLLISLREFLENVRTKGFWIGILMMPVVLVLVAVVPLIIESTRSAKSYAVIDESNWLGSEVQAEISRRDFRYLFTDLRKGREEALLPELAKVLPEIRVLGETGIDEAVASILTGSAPPEALGNRWVAHLSDHRVLIRDWWQKLTPGARADLSARISSNRFVLMEHSGDIETLNQQINSGSLFAYFILGADPVNESAGGRYVSNNLTDLDLQNWYGRIVNRIVRDRRLLEKNIDEETAAWINQQTEFEGIKLDEDGLEAQVDNTDIARQWAPVGFVYFLWISILINTQMLLTNTIEEKSNKLIEVLLSSVSPVMLMGGKILGIAATGLTIILSWIVMALVFFLGVPALLGVELPLDLSSVLAEPWLLLSFLVYFLLGYLFYAALLVGLGSLCNNLKEAQNLILPVQMIQILPILMMIPIGRDPNSTLAQVMSYIPPLTPFVMMNRAAGPPAVSEYITTTLLMVVSIVAAFWLAAKVFRIGILMTGKPPGLREIYRLLRAPVSTRGTASGRAS